uniref:Uncharacterized protein n=1 Tax=Rhizophagus irregularis (strain DAOM 181602 / DAOM 197198 / MUCL 43194) TaxID=747089 RepID=U9T123_RHIID
MDPPTLDEWSSSCFFPYSEPFIHDKTLVKLFYNRLATLLASNNILQEGNFAGLPGDACCDPIIMLESIIHDSVITKQPLWVLSQNISKAFDSVDLRFAL